MENRVVGSEILALVALVGVVAGLLVPKALGVSLDRALLVWLVSSIAIGLLQIICENRNIRFTLSASGVGGLSMTIVFLAFCVIRTAIDGLQGGNNLMISGSPAIASFGMVIVVAPFLFFGTLFVSAMTASCNRLLIGAGKKLYLFGADGLEKVGKLVAAIIALVSVVISLWAAFG
jgi:hypothetical protein